MKQYAQLAVLLLIASACSSGDQRTPTAPGDGASLTRQTGPSISVTSLPSLGGFSTARAINDDQVIVGTSNGLPAKWTLTASGQWAVEALQPTGGQAEDITESGVIVGTSSGLVTLWSPGAAPETIGPGIAAAMNESQIVVGRDNSVVGGSGARAWTRSGTAWAAHVLPGTADAPSGYTEPTDINDDGVIVGAAADASGSTHAVKWIPNTTTGEWDAAVPLDDVAAANFGGAEAIVGQDIVGTVLRCFGCSTRPRDPYHWSLTTGQGIGSLGTADAVAQGLNAQRSIVGLLFFRGQHAFVWTAANPTIRDLGAPNGYQSANAYDINSPKGSRTASQAVGEASARNGKRTAVLWTLP
jgi:probable HAF family extracellular repeat protein